MSESRPVPRSGKRESRRTSELCRIREPCGPAASPSRADMEDAGRASGSGRSSEMVPVD